MPSQDFAGGENPLDNTTSDVRIEAKVGSGETIAYPLKVEIRNFSWVCYVELLNSTMKFFKDGEPSRYGWVKLEARNNQFSIMGTGNLWCSQVIIKNDNPDSTEFIEYITSGSMQRDPLVEIQLNQLKEQRGATKRTSLSDIVKRGYRQFKARVSSAPEKVELTLPTGEFRDAWLRTEEEPYTFKTANMKAEFSQLLESSKDIGAIGPRLRRSKVGVYKYGNIEQQDEEVKYVNSKGQTVDSKTPFVQWSGVKSIEYPFSKPANFKLSKKRFSNLADKQASNIMRPIRMWVDSLGDVEEYAVAAVLGIWRIINVFQK